MVAASFCPSMTSVPSAVGNSPDSTRFQVEVLWIWAGDSAGEAAYAATGHSDALAGASPGSALGPSYRRHHLHHPRHVAHRPDRPPHETGTLVMLAQYPTVGVSIMRIYHMFMLASRWFS